MYNDFQKAVRILCETLELLKQLFILLKQERQGDFLMDRYEVQSYLRISDTTYKRYVRLGKLKPLQLPGGHRYYKSQLDALYRESICKGRI